MWLRIVDINIDARRVHLELAPDGSDAYYTRLHRFVTHCTSEGMVDVRLHQAPGVSRRDSRRVRDFAAMCGLTAPTARGFRRGERNGSPAVEIHSNTPPPAGAQGGPDYEILVRGVGGAVERINTVISLVCASVDLDPRSTLQLRLCVYELASNTVEHGHFRTSDPCIRIGLSFSRESVGVRYRDNATAFLTASLVDVDLVGEHIATSTKRGLGLYMLNKLCSDFDYERVDEWNVSTFTLDVKTNHAEKTRR